MFCFVWVSRSFPFQKRFSSPLHAVTVGESHLTWKTDMSKQLNMIGFQNFFSRFKKFYWILDFITLLNFAANHIIVDQ